MYNVWINDVLKLSENTTMNFANCVICKYWKCRWVENFRILKSFYVENHCLWVTGRKIILQQKLCILINVLSKNLNALFSLLYIIDNTNFSMKENNLMTYFARNVTEVLENQYV